MGGSKMVIPRSRLDFFVGTSQVLHNQRLNLVIGGTAASSTRGRPSKSYISRLLSLTFMCVCGAINRSWEEPSLLLVYLVSNFTL